MEQADQLGELISLWILALVAAPLFGRIRTYLAELELAHEGTLQALISTIELREIETGQHCRRVRDYALMLAEQMGVKDAEFLSGLAQGALLHDIGKIGIPDSVLLKPAGLEPAERSLIETHPTLGADLVGNVRSLEAAKAVVLHHHERFDGEGYPSKLAGTAIPLSARIFSVADVFDAMTSSRPYRGQLPFPEVAAHLQQGAGLQFDPAVVEAFLKVPFHTWAQVARRHGLELKA